MALNRKRMAAWVGEYYGVEPEADTAPAPAAVPLPAPNAPLSAKQAAAVLNISTRKVYDLCESGKIRHSKNPIRIDRADLDAFQEASKVEPTTTLRHLRR
jgi:excisionase family DNA binding protein